ncbi:sensor histidine kinase [Asticcacaulis sp. YBE204]|uniref:sensor histidine kinase n=1 Tax=Asticcacaulis sp. YBE204 TaxID=1282363 RepID=UPI0003C3D292|nr:ATP-binding protein [Asticcacaulis sp. YBE204]ESQ79558.1 histidine kinase [Asticcacaulis sp. YBE204]
MAAVIQNLRRFFGALVQGRGSLAGRLIRLASIWFIFALILISAGLTAFFNYASVTRFQAGINDIVRNLYTHTEFDGDGRIKIPELYNIRTDDIYSGLYWQIIELDNDDHVIGVHKSGSLVERSLDGPKKLDKMSGQAEFYNGIGPRRQPLRQTAVYLRIQNHNLLFIAGEDRSELDRNVGQFALITGGALIVLALGSLIAIYLQVRIGLRPLFRLTDELHDIRKGKTSRLHGSYPAEITPVTEEVNKLLEYGQDVVERQRTHVGNLAHALKTPLSVLLATAGDNPDPLADTIRKQSALMKEQVDHHLRRARAAARAQNMGERTPVEPVLDELAVTLEQVFRDKDVTIDWRAPEDLAFRGEKQDFQEIAGNLLENACIWSKGKVRVTASLSDEAHGMTLLIEDNGPGMPPERYDEVLKRGARLDESAPGSGLGLSIVDELVRAYGGKLSFDKSSLGGLKCVVILPANFIS